MSADIDAKLLRLVQLSRKLGVEETLEVGQPAETAAALDALLGDLSREYAAQAARIAELERELTDTKLRLTGHRRAQDYAARRALTPGGEP